MREGIFNLIYKDYPQFERNSHILLDELNKYRRLYLTSFITQERGELAAIDHDVMNAIRNNSVLSENVQDEKELPLTLGQRMADKSAHLHSHQF